MKRVRKENSQKSEKCMGWVLNPCPLGHSQVPHPPSQAIVCDSNMFYVTTGTHLGN